MKINGILHELLKDPKFVNFYNANKERSAGALSLYQVRTEVGLKQADLAEQANATSNNFSN
ncbi:hypothetical protein [Furfurilactobacillus entadae]|uniref:hypothetical protein n=1 Tax=Furfurilactobacillus entadae TaxID=2922307 RepID=UPI0035EE2FD9